MAKKTTVVNFVLDETGSMDSVRGATISGFNEYINALKQEGGNVLFTLTKFNSAKIQVVYNATAIKDVPELTQETYVPNALTPLYDAIAHTIKATDDAIKGKKTKPAVLCVIMTDGEENASKEYNRESIFKLIKQKEAEGWTFAYMGANQDAWAVGASIGVPMGNTLNYDVLHTGETIVNAAVATSAYFRQGSAQSKSFFSDTTVERLKKLR